MTTVPEPFARAYEDCRWGCRGLKHGGAHTEPLAYGYTLSAVREGWDIRWTLRDGAGRKVCVLFARRVRWLDIRSGRDALTVRRLFAANGVGDDVAFRSRDGPTWTHNGRTVRVRDVYDPDDPAKGEDYSSDGATYVGITVRMDDEDTRGE